LANDKREKFLNYLPSCSSHFFQVYLLEKITTHPTPDRVAPLKRGIKKKGNK